MSQAQFKRSHFIINPRFQYQIISLFFTFSIIMSAAIFVFAWKSHSSFTSKLQEKKTQMGIYTEIVNEYDEKDVTVFWVPKEFKQEFLWELLIFTLLLSIAMIFLGVFISHRIAGPLHRLNHCMLDVAVGKTVPILRFRDHDEFPNLAESFNKCMYTLTSKLAETEEKQDAAFLEIRNHLSNSKDEKLHLGILEILERYQTLEQPLKPKETALNR